LTIITVLTKWSQYRELWSQFSQNCLISKDRDYDYNSHKIHYLWGLHHERSPHKNVMFLSLYRITTIIVVLFIKIVITAFTKMSYIWVFMRIVTLWSQSLQNVLFLSQSSQRTVIISHNPHINIVIINRSPVHWHRTILNAFHI